MDRRKASPWQRLAAVLCWTWSSYFLMSAFLATLLVIGVVWWPLARDVLSYVDWSRPLWLQVDWLLLSIFAAMSLLIMAGADLRADVLILFVGLVGGLVIESWGTQTELWIWLNTNIWHDQLQRVLARPLPMQRLPFPTCCIPLLLPAVLTPSPPPHRPEKHPFADATFIGLPADQVQPLGVPRCPVPLKHSLWL